MESVRFMGGMFLQTRSSPFRFISSQLPPKSYHHRHLYSSTTSRRPARLTKKPCLSLLQACKSMKQLKQIHCQILRSCLHESRDVTDDLLTFCTDPDVGNLHYAAKVFGDLRDPSLFTYNLMIKAFARKGLLRRAISLFDRLRGDDLSPDNFTYPFVLKAIGNLRSVSEAQRIHGFIAKIGLESDPFVGNSLMDMYAMMGRVRQSRELFDKMSQRDVVSWNILISGYVRCGMFGDAVSVFRKMRREGSRPDEATLVSTLSACAQTRNLELGKEIHRYTNEEFRFSIVLENAILDVYGKCGCMSMARRFFDEMPEKNVISWTTMVAAYVNCSQLDAARELFDGSPVKDVVLWTTMINGYVQFNRFEDALAMFREMQMRRIKPDKFTIAVVLTVCARLGALEQGKWMHGYIDENKVKIDVVVGTSLMDMYAKCGCIEKSMEVFRRVQGKDTATWTSMICGLAMNGETSRALQLFSEMRSVGAKPDDITFIGVLSACSHGGLVEEGRRYLRDMKKAYQIEPKLEHYSCFVDLLGRAGLLEEAENLIRRIPERNYNDNNILPLWGALLGACRIHGDVEMGERVAQQFVELELSDSGVHTLLANIYAAADRWEEVAKVRREMKDRSIKKTPGCSSIEVNGAIREFLVGDTSHPETREIYSVLHNMGRVFDLEEVIIER